MTALTPLDPLEDTVPIERPFIYPKPAYYGDETLQSMLTMEVPSLSAADEKSRLAPPFHRKKLCCRRACCRTEPPITTWPHASNNNCEAGNVSVGPIPNDGSLE